MATLEDVKTWRGREAVGPDGEKVGKIDDIYLDRQSGEPEWAAVKTGLFGTSLSFVPLEGATASGEDGPPPARQGDRQGRAEGRGRRRAVARGGAPAVRPLRPQLRRLGRQQRGPHGGLHGPRRAHRPRRALRHRPRPRHGRARLHGPRRRAGHGRARHERPDDRRRHDPLRGGAARRHAAARGRPRAAAQVRRHGGRRDHRARPARGGPGRARADHGRQPRRRAERPRHLGGGARGDAPRRGAGGREEVVPKERVRLETDTVTEERGVPRRCARSASSPRATPVATASRRWPQSGGAPPTPPSGGAAPPAARSRRRTRPRPRRPRWPAARSRPASAGARRRRPSRRRAAAAAAAGWPRPSGAGRRPVVHAGRGAAPHRHAVDGRVLDRRPHRLALVVDARHRLPAELRGGDRQHARATAEVDERAARLELEQKLEAQPRRVVRAGAERLRRVDRRCRCSPAAGGGRQGGAHVHAGSPVSRPAGGTRASARASRRPPPPCGPRRAPSPAAARRSGSAAARPAPRRRRTRRVAQVALLHAAGRQLQQLGQRDLRVLAADAQRQADHRAAAGAGACPARSRPSEVLAAAALSASRSNSSRCSRVEPAGHDDVDDDAQVAAAPGRRSAGIPLPLEHEDLARLRARRHVERPGPSSVGTERRAERGAGAGTSSDVTRSSPSRTKRSSGRTCTRRRGRRAARRARPRARGPTGGCAGRPRCRPARPQRSVRRRTSRPAAVAALAGLLGHAPVAAAHVARHAGARPARTASA